MIHSNEAQTLNAQLSYKELRAILKDIGLNKQTEINTHNPAYFYDTINFIKANFCN